MIMSVLLSIFFLLNTTINIFQCAPKLGHILFDPLSHEAELSGSSIELPKDQEGLLKEHLRMPTKIEETSKKHCSGYDYNETLCRTVDDRIICGYNKNIDNVSDKTVNIGNGCRIRGDRLECGYFEGPFNVSRRPPANDEETDKNNKLLNLRYGPTRTSSILTQFNATIKINKYVLNFTTSKRPQALKISSEMTTKTTKVKTPPASSILTTIMNNSNSSTASYTNVTSISRRSNVTRYKRYCVDKSDRIFCYSIKQ